MSDTSPEPIAIVGIGCRVPGAAGPAELWRLLREGRDEVRAVPPQRWAAWGMAPEALSGIPVFKDGMRAGLLEGLDGFDWRAFRVSPREANYMDPQHRLLLEVAWEMLDDAAVPQERVAATRTGVFVGAMWPDYLLLQGGDLTALDAYATTTHDAFAAHRVSYFFDFRGPSIAFDTACASSLTAVHYAMQSIWSGECDAAVAAGVHLMLTPSIAIALGKAGVLSPHGRCAVFDRGADGFVPAEGAGAIYLKPLTRARADGDRIYALLRGGAVNAGGHSADWIMAPSPSAQEELLRSAYRRAGVDPAEVDYVELHGTGTARGDPVEAGALGAVMGSGRSARLAVGSVKSNIGHLTAAAGIIGVIKTALALHHAELPASLHFREPSPAISFDALGLELQARHAPWPDRGRPRHAGVTGLGFGGGNAHVVLQEAPAPPKRPAQRVARFVLPLSAATSDALKAMANRTAALLEEPATASALGDLCSTAALRRTRHQHAAAVVGASAAELAASLRGASLHAAARPPRVAFVFPGHGGQWPGMGRELMTGDPAFRQAIEACDRAMSAFLPGSIIDKVFAAAEPDLHDAALVQPAIFAMQVGLVAALRRYGVVPDVVLGHSMGEIAAAHVAGALSLEDACRLICERGAICARIAGKGKMLATELSIDDARRLVAGYAGVVVGAHNGSRSTVLSGDTEAMDAVEEELSRQGVFCRRVDIEFAAHSTQLDPLLDSFLAAVGVVRTAPLTARFLPTAGEMAGREAASSDLDARYWWRNAREPVMFDAAIRPLLADKIDAWVEISGHSVLRPVIARTLREAGNKGAVIAASEREREHAALLELLAALWCLGAPVEWASLYDEPGAVYPLPAYPWQRERCWFDAAPARANRALAGGAAGATQHGDAHPLLGGHVELATPGGAHAFTVDLDKQTVHGDDHRIQGAAVLTGAAYLEMALAAAERALGPGPWSVAELHIRRAFVFPEEATRKLQLLLFAGETEPPRFEIHMQGRRSDEQPWILGAHGQVVRDVVKDAQERVSLDDVRARCREEAVPADVYARLQAVGNHYGPAYRGIELLHLGPGEALAEIRVPHALVAELPRYRFHPAVCDACAHLAVLAGGAPRPFVPVRIGHMRVFERPAVRLWSHARVRPESVRPDSFSVDVRAYDQDGRLALEIEDLELQILESGIAVDAPERLEWLYNLGWEPAPPPVAAERWRARAPGSWIVIGGRDGTGAELSRLLTREGERCLLARTEDATQMETVQALVRTAAQKGPIRGVVLLAALDAARETLGADQRRTITAALHAARALIPEESRSAARLFMVTRGCQAVAADDPISVEQAPLWGFGRSFAFEHPSLWGGLLDLDPDASPTQAATDLLGELRTEDAEDQVAYRDGRRHLARLSRMRVVRRLEKIAPLAQDGTYFITGGLGALGLHSARWLADNGAGHIVLVSRRTPPDRGQWDRVDPQSPAGKQIARIREIESLGAAVTVAAADVGDSAALSAVIERAIAGGARPLRGVIHCAGVGSLRPVAEMTADDYESMARAKVDGAWTLHEATLDQPIDFFVLYSSASSILNSPQLAHYAAGNAFLDALAHHRRALGRPALSVNWGMWKEGGMADDVLDGGQSSPRAMSGMDPAEALVLLEQLVQQGATEALVIPVDWREFGRLYPRAARLPFLSRLTAQAKSAEPLPASPPPASAPTADALVVADAARRPALVAEYLAAHASRILRIPSASLSVDQPLRELGLDSLMGMELRSALEADLSVSVRLANLLSRMTLAQLAEHVLHKLEPASRKETAAVAGEPSAAPASPPSSSSSSSSPQERDGPFPLTDLQQAYWMGQAAHFELGNVFGHFYVEYEFQELDLDRLQRALERVVERHEMLRAVVTDDGMVRVLDEPVRPALAVRDLRHAGAAEVEQALAEVREDMTQRGPRTDRWPLFEWVVVRRPDLSARVHVSFALIAADGESLGTILHEMAALYRDPAAALPPFTLGPRDVRLAIEAQKGTEAYTRDREYWWRRLPTFPSGPELPLEKSLAAVGRPRFGHRTERIEAVAWRRFKTTAAELGLTPTAALATAFAEVIGAWSKSQRFGMNVLVQSRPPFHPEVHRVVGNFSSTLLLDIDLSARDAFVTRARDVQEQLAEAMEHGLVSGVEVVRELNRLHGSARALMPVVFATLLGAEEPFPREWADAWSYGVIQTPHVLLDHQTYERKGALVFNWDMVEEVFPPGVCAKMFRAYADVVGTLAADASAWKRPLSGLTPKEDLDKRRALNRAGTPAPRATLHGLARDAAVKDAAAPAVITADRTLSHGELGARARALSRALRERDARANTMVAVVMEKGWEQVVGALAVLHAGAAYLPIDPGVPPDRLRALLASAEVRVVLTQPRVDQRLVWPPGVERIVVDGAPADDAAAADDASAEGATATPEDLAYVIYTSGSTGRPKGVMITHAGAVNTIVDVNERFHVGPADRVLALAALTFDLSVYDIFGPLAAGGAVVMPEALRQSDPAHWLDLLERHQVTIWNTVPAMMEMLVEHCAGRRALPADLRLVLLSGDWIPVNLPERVRALSDKVEVVSLGGATEASIWSVIHPIGEVDAGATSIPYGVPMRNQTLHVEDQAFEPRPVFVPGQLYIGGAGVALGYWRDDERTAERFVRHPRTGERLYRTGDVARYLPDGTLEFLGRDDQQVKVQGYRIELGEIEAALLQHARVRAAVATVRGKERGPKSIAAYVVGDKGAPPSPGELRALLLSKLPEYMVPQSFGVLDALPLGPNGKVDRRLLPDTTAPATPRKRTAPRNALEERLAEIWRSVLEVETIGVEDNFFELGGQSLMAVRLVARVRAAFGRELPVSTVLTGGGTIAEMAKLLEDGGGARRSPLVAIQPRGDRTPLFFVHPAGGGVLCYAELARGLGTDRPFYGLECPGVHPGAAPLSLTEAVEAYLAAVRSVRAHGPYALGGWSSGGVIAVEMAERLIRAGESVPLVALIDTWAPGAAPALDDGALTEAFLRDLAGGRSAPGGAGGAGASGASAERALRTGFERARAAGLVPPEMDVEQALHLFGVYRSNAVGARAHRLEPARAPLALFRAARPLFKDADASLGWAPVAARIDVVDVPADHFTLLTPPAVSGVARALATMIDGITRG